MAKWPVCLYPTYGGADPLANVVNKMSRQLGDMFNGRIDGYNVDPGMFDPAMFIQIPGGPPGGPPLPPLITLPPLKPGSGGSLIQKKDTIGVTRGLQLEVDASSAADGKVCVTDKDYPDQQLISLVPDDPASVTHPGAVVQTNYGELAVKSATGYDLVMAPGLLFKVADATDPTKRIAVDLSLLGTSGVTRAIKFQDASHTLAGINIPNTYSGGGLQDFGAATFRLPSINKTTSSTTAELWAKSGGTDRNLYYRDTLSDGAGGVSSIVELQKYRDAASGYAGLDAATLLKAAEFPAFTGDVTKAAGSLVTVLAAGSAAALNSGTLADARLSANVVMINASATFGAHTYDFTGAIMCIPILTADPGSPVEGQFWFRSDITSMRVRTGGVTYSRAFA